MTGEHRTAQRRPIDGLARLALPALSVWLLAEGMPKLPGEYFAEQARVALRDDHEVAAINDARRGLEYEADNPLLYYYLGESRTRIAEHREAAGATNPADPINASYRQEALEAFRHAYVLAPNDSVVLMRLGETLTRLGKLDEAGVVFDRLQAWDPNSGLAQTYYGFFLQRAGRFAEAEAAYRRALNLDPKPAASAGLDEIGRERAAAGPPTS